MIHLKLKTHSKEARLAQSFPFPFFKFCLVTLHFYPYSSFYLLFSYLFPLYPNTIRNVPKIYVYLFYCGTLLSLAPPKLVLFDHDMLPLVLMGHLEKISDFFFYIESVAEDAFKYTKL